MVVAWGICKLIITRRLDAWAVGHGLWGIGSGAIPDITRLSYAKLDASTATRARQQDMKINLARFAIPLSACLLAGCATTQTPDVSFAEPVVAETRVAQLADATARELAHLARFEPDLLEEVGPELRALAMALVVSANMPVPESDPDAPSAVLLPPPADMAEATSLRHGIHLASYRLLENAQSGWSQLRERHRDLLGAMDARLETTHLDGRGIYLRLKVGPYDNAAAAARACQVFLASEDYCMPVDFSGQPLAE